MKSQRYGRSHPRSGFTPQEDCLLIDLVAQFGNDSWTTIASYMEKRNARQCKDRYNSYLSPTINKGPFTEEEDDLLRKKYNEIGPKWVKRNNLDSTSDNYSSSPVDPDFVFERADNSLEDSIIIEKHKDGLNKKQKKSSNINTISKTNRSTMTLRKRNRKHFDYNESDEDNFDIDFDEIMQSKDQISDENKSNSSCSTVSTPPSLSSTVNSTESSPKPTINNSFHFSSEENTNVAPYNGIIQQTFSNDNNFSQNQSRFTSELNTMNVNPSEEISSVNQASLFDFFSFYYKENEEMFTEYHTPMLSNPVMNMDLNGNENFNQFHQNKGFELKNSTGNLNKLEFNNGNYNNNFQSNTINNPLIHSRNASSFTTSTLNEPNNNFYINDKKRDFKPDDDIFTDDLNWDICWDVQCSC